MTALLVEVTDFAEAARAMYGTVADPADVASGRLASALSELGAMAGNDAGGEAWAKVYDPAARSALLAAQQVVNGAYVTSSMFARSGLNYAAAESASGPGHVGAGVVRTGDLPPEGWSGPPPVLPTAAGGGGGHPHGWSLVEHLIGYLWPNGHQDRLHRAARAWTSAADEFEDLSSHAAVVPVGFARDALPEADDMCTVCRGLSGHLSDLAAAFRTLAGACSDLAHHIDVCHRAVTDELQDLLAWSAGIQAGGALVSVATIGIAEAPTQAVQLAKIAAAAERVEKLILVFVDAARALADTLPSVAMAAERIRVAMEGLSGARLAVAGMEAVPSARAVGAAGKGVRLTKQAEAELAATERLADEAAPAVTHFADRDAARSALPAGELRASANRFFRRATMKCRDFTIIRLASGGYRFEYFAPADNPGYGKLYVQLVDQTGRRLERYKDTMGPNGLIERK